jgi:predicted neuraminidase
MMACDALLLAVTLAAAVMIAAVPAGGAGVGAPPGLVRTEFIFETAPFAECHASTLAESRGGLVAAWFGGPREGHPEVGIWLARLEGGQWTAPVEVATGVESPEKRHPCWNPVLFQPRVGPLMLFYKVGPSPKAWWGMLLASDDAGKSWSKPRRLPEGILGPIKNKPVELAGGDILCPSSTEHAGWRVHFERTNDLGKTWQVVGPVNDGREIGAIQPSLLLHGQGRLQAIGRTANGRLFEIRSEDGGRTWGKMTLAALPNPNSGLDAVTLTDGRHLLVYNHTSKGRSPLNVAVSADGIQWQAALVLENETGEFSYPSVIQAADGLVHVTYTWKRRRIRHGVLDPAQLVLRPIVGGAWPGSGGNQAQAPGSAGSRRGG